MAAGDILRTDLYVSEKVLVKENEDIELGELICDDGSGNGFVAATAALAKTGLKVYMAEEAHDYSEVSYHYIRATLLGKVTVQKVSGSGAAKHGDKAMLSATPGEATKFVKGDLPAGGVSTYYTSTIETNAQAAVDTNLGIIGTVAADAADADTTMDIWLGVI